MDGAKLGSLGDAASFHLSQACRPILRTLGCELGILAAWGRRAEHSELLYLRQKKQTAGHPKQKDCILFSN